MRLSKKPMEAKMARLTRAMRRMGRMSIWAREVGAVAVVGGGGGGMCLV